MRNASGDLLRACLVLKEHVSTVLLAKLETVTFGLVQAIVLATSRIVVESDSNNRAHFITQTFPE